MLAALLLPLLAADAHVAVSARTGPTTHVVVGATYGAPPVQPGVHGGVQQVVGVHAAVAADVAFRRDLGVRAVLRTTTTQQCSSDAAACIASFGAGVDVGFFVPLRFDDWSLRPWLGFASFGRSLGGRNAHWLRPLTGAVAGVAARRHVADHAFVGVDVEAVAYVDAQRTSVEICADPLVDACDLARAVVVRAHVLPQAALVVGWRF